MEVGIPVFMTTEAGLPINAIGIVFFFNTLVIVVAQVWVIKRIEGRSRLEGVAARGRGVVGVLGAARRHLAVSSLAAAVVITVGVSIFRRRGDAVVAGRAVARERLRRAAPAGQVQRRRRPGLERGRRDRALAFAGALLGAGLGVLWALLVAAGALVAGLVLLSLRRLLTPAEDGRAGVPMTDGVAGVRG